ncbi:hypothetical protein [uncultured Shewanella sp.]|uniref:hypothetical protein n=1 Tax=uncultured Shewanella sp. TaxID=173975 RepID=UPI00260B58D1|nr:hypothetical protein [uncultured Shewanella sp.]
MERIREAQEYLLQEFEIYNNASSKKLPALDINCPDNLETMLEFVTRRESLKQTKKPNYPPAAKLKSAIADTLLLLDNFDMKVFKEQGAKEK